MKTLIINGSPRQNGDTVALLLELKKHLKGEIIELSAYRDKINPCTDCRYCWTEAKCIIDDDMQKIYDGGYDNIVIASPIHLSGLPGPLVSLIGRFQVYYAAKKIANKKIEVSPKKGALILVGGREEVPSYAIRIVKWMFKRLGVNYDDEFMVLSLNTDKIPVLQNAEVIEKIKKIADHLSKQ